MSVPEVYIQSVGTALPGEPVDNATLMHRLGLPAQWDEWLGTFVGTVSRHLAINLDTGAVRCSLSELCTEAASLALSRAGRSGQDIDLIVLGTAAPEALVPTAASLVADRLGAGGIPAYQLQSGCSGAYQAFGIAYQLLLTGRYRTALAIGGEVFAKFFDLGSDFNEMPTDELLHYFLFGDGAGAAVLSTEPTPGALRIESVRTELSGTERPPGQILNWFGPGDRNSGLRIAEEDYKAIESLVPQLSLAALGDLLAERDWEADDIDFIMPPQLSTEMTQRIVTQLKLPTATEISCVRHLGNNGNAALFFQLDELAGKISEGNSAIGIAIESSKWIKASLALRKI
jgi:3-oxoacyl-[acyl-carrier-protein] synthase III